MEQKEFTDMAEILRLRIIAVAQGFRLSDEDADDVSQDVMLKLWTICKDIKDNRSAVSLAVTMAKNLSIDKLRRETKNGNNDIELVDSQYCQPDYILEDNENTAWLKDRLKRLPTKEYLVLHLRQVEKKSTEEIAAIVGIKPVSVPTMLSRARRKLLDDIKKRTL